MEYIHIKVLETFIDEMGREFKKGHVINVDHEFARPYLKANKARIVALNETERPPREAEEEEE